MQAVKDLLQVFKPNKAISSQVFLILVGIQVAAVVLLWTFFPPLIIPTPWKIICAFPSIWQDGIMEDLWISFSLNLKVLGVSAVLSLGLSYLTTLPFFRPIVAFVSKLRFWSLVGLVVVFMLATTGGGALKVTILTFCMTVCAVTAMSEVVASVPQEELDYARTMRMSEWRVIWEVIILGRIDSAIEVMRQNAAIGWMMLTMVEGYARGEGGVGVYLLNQSKHFHLDVIFAVQISIFMIALLQDYLFGKLKAAACPYAVIEQDRRRAR